MLQLQLRKCYNLIDCGHAKHEFFNKVLYAGSIILCITVNEVSNALRRPKKDKSKAKWHTYRISYVCRYSSLCKIVHLSVFFTFCLRHCYIPIACMSSMVIPLLRNEGDGLTDIDNDRAIAIANAKTSCLKR